MLFYVLKATRRAIWRLDQRPKVTSEPSYIYTIHVLPGFEPGSPKEDQPRSSATSDRATGKADGIKPWIIIAIKQADIYQ